LLLSAAESLFRVDVHNHTTLPYHPMDRGGRMRCSLRRSALTLVAERPRSRCVADGHAGDSVCRLRVVGSVAGLPRVGSRRLAVPHVDAGGEPGVRLVWRAWTALA